ncbi:MAG: LptF/LptG family permease [bacterium]
MKLLDKFILKEIITVFLFGVITFTSLILGVGAVFKILRLAMDYHTGLLVVAQLFLLKLPEVIMYTLPMSVLFCILLVFSRMSTDLEITAFRAAGVSFLRLVLPVLVFAAVVTVFGLVMTDRLVPLSNEMFNRLVNKATSGEKKTKERTIFYRNSDEGIPREEVYALSIDGDVMREVQFQKFSDGRLEFMVRAEQARWKRNSWVFHKGFRYDYIPDGEMKNIVKFEKMDIIFLVSPTELIQQQKSVDTLSFKELSERIVFLKRAQIKERDLRKLQVDFHAKIAIPFASFMFALIAAPLGLHPQRTSSSIGLGLSVIIIFFYYTFQHFFRIMGQGWMNPAAAAWVPNLILLFIGIWLNWKANR